MSKKAEWKWNFLQADRKIILFPYISIYSTYTQNCITANRINRKLKLNLIKGKKNNKVFILYFSPVKINHFLLCCSIYFPFLLSLIPWYKRKTEIICKFIIFNSNFVPIWLVSSPYSHGSMMIWSLTLCSTLICGVCKKNIIFMGKKKKNSRRWRASISLGSSSYIWNSSINLWWLYIRKNLLKYDYQKITLYLSVMQHLVWEFDVFNYLTSNFLHKPNTNPVCANWFFILVFYILNVCRAFHIS